MSSPAPDRESDLAKRSLLERLTIGLLGLLAAGLALRCGALVMGDAYALGLVPRENPAALAVLLSAALLAIGVIGIAFIPAGRPWRLVFVVPAGLVAIGNLLLMLDGLTGGEPIWLQAFARPLLAANNQIPQVWVPFAACLFTLALAQLIKLLPPRALGRGRRGVTLGLSLVVAILFLLELMSESARLSLLAPTNRPSDFPWLGLVLSTVAYAQVIAAGLGRTLRNLLLGPDVASTDTERRRRRRSERAILLASLGLALVLGLLGGLYLRQQMQEHRSNVQYQLGNLVEIEAAQLARWYEERLRDLALLRSTPFLAESLIAFAGDPANPVLRTKLDAFLAAIYDRQRFREIVLLDPGLHPLLTLPARPNAPAAPPAGAVRELEQGHDWAVSDIYSPADGDFLMDYLAPIRAPGDGRMRGAVLLRADIGRQLSPLLSRTEVGFETLATGLARRQGSIIEVINPAGRPGTELKLIRMSLTDTRLPAVIAVTQEPANLIRGVDYRGIWVLAMARPVPGTSWKLIAKVDRVEAYGPLLTETWTNSLILSLILLTSLVLLGASWRRRERRFVQQQGEAEAVRTAAIERLAQVLKQANDAIVLFDTDKRIIETNDRALEMYGYADEEMRRLSALDLRAKDAVISIGQDFATAMTDKGLIFETRHRRKDGSIIPVEVNARGITVNGRRHVLSVIRDITERQRHEQELERLNRLYQVISQVNLAIVKLKTPTELFTEICRVLVEVGGFKLAWVGMHDPATGRILPTVTAGDKLGYVANLRVSADGTQPDGRGPTGTAFRENRTVVCADFATDPLTQPWHERATRSGLCSSFSLPFRREGQPVGVLTVYAGEANAFGPREVAILEESAGDVSYALDVMGGETRRLEAERQVRLSQERLSFLVSATPTVIYTFNATGAPKVTYVSPNVEKLNGHPPETFTSNDGFWLEQVHPDDRAPAFAALAQLADRESVTREYRFRHRDGTYRWTLDEVRLVRDQEGRPLEYIGSWLDITDRKQADEERARQEARFRFIFEHAPVGISLVVGNGLLVNPEHARITGVPVADSNLPGVFAKASHPADYAKQIIASGPYARSEVEQYSIEKRYLHSDGKVVWARLSSHWFVDPAIGERQSLTIITDITKEKENEQELARQAARFRFIFEHLPIGVSLRTAAHGLEVNPAHTRITGVAAADSNLPDAFARATHPEDYARQLEISARFVRHETPSFSLEKRYVHPDGKVVWVAFTSHWFQEPVTGEYQALTTITDITDRKQAEDALRAREEVFSTIVSQAADAIVLVDGATGRFIEFNQTAHESLGYTREEFAVLQITDIQAEHSPEVIRANFERILTVGSVAFESRHRHRDGQARDVRVSARRITLRGREYIAAVWSDITEQKRLHAELRTSEERHRALFDNMDLGVAYQDATGAITTANAAAARILGLSLEQMQGRKSVDPSWRAIREDGSPFPGEHHPAMLALQTGRRVQNVVMGIHAAADTAPRWLLVSSVPEFTAGNPTPHRVFTIFTDITERRLAEEEMKKLSLAVEQNPSSIVITDLHGDIEYANPRFTEVSGYSLSEVLGRNPRILKSGLTPPAVYTDMWRTITGGETWRGEFINRRRDGSLYTEMVVVTPVNDAQGLPLHYMALKEDITARKRAQQSLEESERRYRLIAENTADMIWVADAQTACFTYVSPAVRQLRGYEPEELVGRQIHEFTSSLAREFITREVRERGAALAAGDESARRRTYELEVERKDGSLMMTEVATTLVTDATGQVTQIIGVTRDITARKRAELELRASEQLLESTGRMARVGGWKINLVNQELSWSAETRRIHEVGSDFVPNVATAIGFYAPEFQPVIQRLVEQAVSDGKPWDVEHRIITASGRARWVRTQGELVMVDGRKGYIQGTIQDITERRAADENLRKLSRIIEQAPLSIAITDLSGALEYVNPRFSEVTGYTLEEVRGQNPRVLKSGTTPASVYVEMWRTLTTGHVWRGELVNRKKNGELYVEQAVIAPVADERGTVSHYVALKEDITTRKRLEESLAEAQRLYRLVAENTADVIWLYDLARERFEYVSPSVSKLLGYTVAEVMPLKMPDLVAPSDRARIFAELPPRIAAFATGDESTHVHFDEMAQLHRDGREIPAEVVTTLLPDDAGRPTLLLGVSRDITQRVQANAALRRSEELYRLIAENTSDAIWILDLATRQFTYMSPSAARLLGRDPSELLGHAFDQFLTPEATALAARNLAGRLQALAQGDQTARTTMSLLDHVHRDGHIVRGEVVSTVLLDPAGRPVQVLGVSRDVTERETAAAALRSSRDRLAKAETIAHVGNWERNLVTQEMSWSDEVFRILELDPAQGADYDKYRGRVHPDDLAPLQAEFDDASARRRQFLFGLRLLLPDGRVKYVEQTGQIDCTPDGKPLRAFGTLQDVTTHKLVELELHELVKGLRALHLIAQAIERPDATPQELLEQVATNLPPALRYPELARCEVEFGGWRCSGGAHGPLAAELSAPIVINGETAGRIRVGYVRIPPTGRDDPFFVREREVVENIARTMGSGLGGREAMTAIKRFNAELEEIVARRTAELARRNREVQALLDAIPDMVMRLRLDGTVLLCQHARGPDTLASLAATEAGAAGVNRDLLQPCTELGWHALAENATVASELNLTDAAGRHTFELRAAPVAQEEFVVFIRDITARKRLESETATMLAREREVSEMKTRFISVTSHEFRTPMAAALGSVELLARHFDRMTVAKRNELLNRIGGSLHRMNAMLDELLTLNRLDAKRVEVRPQPLDLRLFLQGAIEEVRLGDQEAHRFEFEAEGVTAEFGTDRNLFHHIVSNLLSNAARYSPAGTDVAIQLRQEAARLVLTVRDHGIGVPEADRARIFEPFERGSNVANIKGTGLGLNIVKRMTELMGGTITVADAPGGGACFTLTLPALTSVHEKP